MKRKILTALALAPLYLGTFFCIAYMSYNVGRGLRLSPDSNVHFFLLLVGLLLVLLAAWTLTLYAKELLTLFSEED